VAPSTSVVIVNYNGWPLLRGCLASLREQERPADEIIVVDNGSEDETTRLLPVEFPEVRLVEAGRNLGFAAGNNLGIAHARGEVVVLLNNDTVAEPGFIARIIEPLERDPAVGAVAATMVFAGAPDIVASAGIEVYRDGLALDRGVGLPRATLAAPAPVFGASAGAVAYRRAALDDVGFFPEPFFYVSGGRGPRLALAPARLGGGPRAGRGGTALLLGLIGRGISLEAAAAGAEPPLGDRPLYADAAPDGVGMGRPPLRGDGRRLRAGAA